MKIEYLKLHNWCSLADKEFDFQNGLIGIFGHNGAGKSTSMQAIGFGLTGVTTGRREDCLRYGTKEGYVIVGFRLDSTGESYRVVRNIHNADVVLYKWQNSEWVRMTQKAPQARELLESLTTITKDMITQILMVSQETVTAILSDTSSQRNEIFQRIFSLQILPKLRDRLNKLIRSVEVKLSNLTYQREFLVDKLRSHREAIKAYGAVESREVLDKQISELTQEIGKLDALLGQIHGMQYLQAEHSRLELQMANLRKKLASKPPVNPYPNENRGDLTAKRLELVEHISLLKQISTPISELLAYPKVNGPSQEELQELYKTLSAKTQEVLTVESEYKKYYACSSTGICPICGSHVNSTLEDLEAIKVKLDSLKKEKDTLYSQYKILETTANSVRVQNTKADANIELCRSLSKALGYDLPENWLDYLKTKVKEDYRISHRKVNELQNILEAIDGYTRDYDSWKTTLNGVKEQLEQLQKSIDGIKLNPLYCAPFSKNEAEIEAESSGLKTCYKQVQEKYHYRMQYEALITQQKETNKDLEKLDIQIADLQPELVDSLKAMSNLLAPSEFPRRVSASLYHLLTDRINSCLEEFDFPFTVDITDSGEFTCQKSNGMLQSSSRLSGGEKMVVSIAFRLALHDLFAQRDSAGFILLDEPTTFLDESNRKYLKEVLGHLKASPRFGGMQIFVVTHDDSLRPLFDNIIDLES